MSVEIRWLGGNCPVQAEGTFDGVEFYFRARGTGVTCDVGEWVWEGPTYEWPEAGWISEDMARAYIDHAYADWKRQESRGPRNDPIHDGGDAARGCALALAGSAVIWVVLVLMIVAILAR